MRRWLWQGISSSIRGFGTQPIRLENPTLVSSDVERSLLNVLPNHIDVVNGGGYELLIATVVNYAWWFPSVSPVHSRAFPVI